MIFEINKKRCEGKMTLTMADETYIQEDKEITQTIAYLNLAINMLVTDIEKIICPIGVFKKIKLSDISIGTESAHVVYSVRSEDFSLNFGETEKMLEQNKKEGED